MKKLVLAMTLALGISTSALADWPMWNDFKAVGIENGRVILVQLPPQKVSLMPCFLRL